MSNFSMYKNTAAGVAKLRFIESCSKSPVIEDPYSHHFVLGTSIIRLLGHYLNKAICDRLSPGLFDGIIARTKIIDETVLDAVNEGATQYVILGAGYDTRGHRLDLPSNVKVFEVDQPDIQKFKVGTLSKVDVPNKTNVNYVSVNFNTQSLETELLKAEGFDPKKKTVVTLEGVSYYIPRESVANTIKKIAPIVGSGSTFFLSYADKNCVDNPNLVCSSDNKRGVRSIKRLMWAVRRIGEPWINFFQKDELPSFFKSNGFTLASDVSLHDLHAKYFCNGREISSENLLFWERFAIAKK
mmetsp:Transcript_1981/g.3987  ORF Transcript_1981/g.3987 Transcript_1981/m.3987 type:complete len:298 (-) Transcript_1981:32-925(-)